MHILVYQPPITAQGKPPLEIVCANCKTMADLDEKKRDKLSKDPDSRKGSFFASQIKGWFRV